MHAQASAMVSRTTSGQRVATQTAQPRSARSSKLYSVVCLNTVYSRCRYKQVQPDSRCRCKCRYSRPDRCRCRYSRPDRCRQVIKIV